MLRIGDKLIKNCGNCPAFGVGSYFYCHFGTFDGLENPPDNIPDDCPLLKLSNKNIKKKIEVKICPNCNNIISKYKPLFLILIFSKVYFRTGDEIKGYTSEVDYIRPTNLKRNNFRNNLKSAYKSAIKLQNENNVVCIMKRVKGKYVYGKTIKFPDNTYIWIPLNITSFEPREFIKEEKLYWQIGAFKENNEVYITNDPKKWLSLDDIYYLSKEDKYKLDTGQFKDLELTGKFYKLNDDVYFEKSREWNKIIKTSYCIKFEEWIKDINTNSDEFQDWLRPRKGLFY